MKPIKVLFFVISSATLYLGFVFAAFHFFSEGVGAQLKVYLSIGAVVILVIYFIFIKIRDPRDLAE